MEKQQKKPVFLQNVIDDSHQFQPLPRPTGLYPFRLDIQEILGGNTHFLKERMSFHMVGDTGSSRFSAFQSLISHHLSQQAMDSKDESGALAFFYHLGDIVYNYGEASEYPNQFFEPYEDYPAQIFAIAGNHDGDVNPNSEFGYQSLDAFIDVFCDNYRRNVIFSRRSKRISMNQPHVYWTLLTPLAHFIGLYANVTKHGTIAEDQRQWFVEELRYADAQRPHKAIIVCLHQAPYSADTNHGSSPAMIDFLERSFQEAGVLPDAVFSGHVHNYQRFSKTHESGATVPYIVAGAGGYADLHRVAQPDNPFVAVDNPLFEDIRLDNYCDDRFGFLKIAIEKTADGLLLVGEYYTIPQEASTATESEAVLFERFYVPIGQVRGDRLVDAAYSFV